MRKLHTWALGLATILTLGCGSGDDDAIRDVDSAAMAREVLERAADALRDVDAVAYDFEWGAVDNPSGWVTGRTRMRRVTDVDDSWIRVEGTVHAQPAFGVEEVEFEYVVDGETAWARDGAGEWRTAPTGDGANTLATNAVFGYLPEFVEARPLWKELGPGATASLRESEVVDGELCDVVEIVIRPGVGNPATTAWSIARSDSLPRRGRWPSTNAPPMVFTLTELEVDPPLERDDFRIAGVEATSAALATGVGDPVPPFTLATVGGRRVTSTDLAGRVAVLDFWNTWCYLCRTMAPETRALAREYAGRSVLFLGVNVYETGDPVVYWRDAGAPYPLLLEGDALARALDLPWQPGVAVVAADGTLLWKALGAMPDRAEKIRAAVDEGLTRLDASAR